MSILTAGLEVQSPPTEKAEKLPPPSEPLVGQPLLAPLAPIVFVRGSEPTLRATLSDKYQPVNPLPPANRAEEPVRIIFSDVSWSISDLTAEAIHWSTASSFPRAIRSRVDCRPSASLDCTRQALGATKSNQTVGLNCPGLEMARQTEATWTLQYGEYLFYELGVANTPPHPALGQRNTRAQPPN
jgi:hypothetical protein